MPPIAFATSPAIEQLNALLRAELGAAETCDRARDLAGPELLPALMLNRESHRARALLAGTEIQLRGGEPSVGWGIWPEIAAWCGAARRPGAADLLALLADGERRHLLLCQRTIERVDAQAADFIRGRILPAQEAVLARLRPAAAVPMWTPEPRVELVRRMR